MTRLVSFLRDPWYLATQYNRRRKWERAIERKARREMAATKGQQS